MDNTTNANEKVITLMSFEEWAEINDNMNQRTQNRTLKDRCKRQKYYNRQKVMGIIIAIVGIILLLVGSNIRNQVMEYFGCAVGFIGLYVILTKQMLLVDSYYLEYKERLERV